MIFIYFAYQSNKEQNILQLYLCDTRIRVFYVKIALYITVLLSACAFVIFAM